MMDRAEKRPKLPTQHSDVLSKARAAADWGPAKRLGFRLLFSYFVLYSFPFPLGWLPWTEKVSELYGKLLDPMVLWVSANLLGIDYPIATEFNGSGDRTYDYVLGFCQLSLAIGATATWSLLHRRARSHERLLEGLRLYVRIVVGATLLSYGFAKIFRGQFIPPGPGQLMQTYGESSPMHLLWTFMGFSRPYTMFAGFMEAIPGGLLLFRRTTYVGALLLLTVLGNVVLLNLCYDVPVKLYSFHLWLMCLFLAAPSLPRLVSALILNRPLPVWPAPRFFASQRARMTGVSLYAILLCAIAYQATVPQWKRHIDLSTPAPELTGLRDLFHVEEMTLDGVVLPPQPASATRWSRVWIRRQTVRIYWPDGRSEIYESAAEIKGPMTLELRLLTDKEATRRAVLDLRKEGDRLILAGDFEGKKVLARLAKVEAGKSLLMSRGFHWINEMPYNR